MVPGTRWPPSLSYLLSSKLVRVKDSVSKHKMRCLVPEEWHWRLTSGLHIHAHIHAPEHKHTPLHTYVHTYTCTHMGTHTSTHTHLHTYIHKNAPAHTDHTHAPAHTDTQDAPAHTQTHINSTTHRSICTYTPTHTHTIKTKQCHKMFLIYCVHYKAQRITS